MAGKIGDLKIGLGLNLTGLVKDLKRSEFLLKRQAAKFKALGSSMTSAFTLPFAAIGGASVKLVVDLETAFGKIQNLVGASTEELKQYKQGVKEISSQTAVSQLELVGALEFITSAGIKGSEALDTLRQSAKAGAAGLGDILEIADITTSAMNAYSKEGLTAARATDILFATATEAKRPAAELAPALGKILGLASSMGVSFEEVGASVATFSKQGVNAKEAVTGLQGILSTFLKVTPEVEKELVRLGTSGDEVRKMIDDDGLVKALGFLIDKSDGNIETIGKLIPNVRALTAVLGTAGTQGEVYAQVQENINKELALTDNAFDNVSKGSGFRFKAVLNQLTNAGIEIGSKLLPFALKAANAISNIISKFQGLSNAQKDNILKWAGIIAAAGPALIVFGKLIGAFGSLKGAIGLVIPRVIAMWGAIFSPIGLAVGAFALLAVGIINNWDKVRGAITSVINTVIGLYNESILFRGVVNGVVLMFENMWTILKGIFSIVGNIGSVLKKVLTGDFDDLGDLISGAFEDIKENGKAIGEGIGDNIAKGIENTLDPKELLKVTEDDVQAFVQPLVDGVKSIQDKASNLLGSFTGGGAGGGTSADTTKTEIVKGRELIKAPAAIGGGVSELDAGENALDAAKNLTQAKEAVIELEESIKGGLVESTILLGESFGSILSGSESFTDGIKNLGKGLLGVLSDVLQKVGKQIIQAGVAMLALKKALNFGSPLAAIAAGVGLVAIAKIAQAKISASVPKLASGGVLTGETLFIGGEYSGASTNPEIVTPQNIMAETFRKVLGQSGGGGGVGVLHMDTIRFGLEKDNVRVN